MELLGPEVASIEFSYFDGPRVVELLGFRGAGTLPVAVRINLYIIPKEIRQRQESARRSSHRGSHVDVYRGIPAAVLQPDNQHPQLRAFAIAGECDDGRECRRGSAAIKPAIKQQSNQPQSPQSPQSPTRRPKLRSTIAGTEMMKKK